MAHDWQEQSRVYAERIRMLELISLADSRDAREMQKALRQAARIFELLRLGKPGFEQVTLADLTNWLELPVVKEAAGEP